MSTPPSAAAESVPGVSLTTATRALFVGLLLLLAAAGLYGTVIGIRAARMGFGAVELGLLGSAYYGGFMVGSRLIVHSLGSVGHIRVYAALATVMASTVLLSGYVDVAPAWIVLRFVSGLCLAGLYVVAESWLNNMVGNEQRGRLLTSYVLVTIVGYAVGQWLSGRLPEYGSEAFAAGAILICLAVVPVALSEAAQPPFQGPTPSVSIRELLEHTPTGLVTTMLVGLAHGAFLGLNAIYATQAGLAAPSVGAFVAMPTVGSLIASFPTAWLADRIDRRIVAIGDAAIAAAAGFLLVITGPTHPLGWLAMALVGAASFPLYSIAGAYANDHVPSEWMNAAASRLVMLFGVGAATGPMLGSLVMKMVGVNGFGWTILGTHAIIGLFLLVRIVQFPPSVRARPELAVPLDGAVAYVPATALGSGRRLRLPRLPRPRRPNLPKRNGKKDNQSGAGTASTPSRDGTPDGQHWNPMDTTNERTDVAITGAPESNGNEATAAGEDRP